MVWSWLQRMTGFAVSEDKRSLPGLYKPGTSDQQQQQQQQSGGHPATQQQHQQPQQPPQKEYCLRMAFKLTPTYSSKLQVCGSRSQGRGTLSDTATAATAIATATANVGLFEAVISKRDEGQQQLADSTCRSTARVACMHNATTRLKHL
jgi:hypothetical protein